MDVIEIKYLFGGIGNHTAHITFWEIGTHLTIPTARQRIRHIKTCPILYMYIHFQ